MNRSTKIKGTANNFAMPKHVRLENDLIKTKYNTELWTNGYEIEVSGRESGRDI